jgi:hypothetical protein
MEIIRANTETTNEPVDIVLLFFAIWLASSAMAMPRYAIR